VSSTGIAFLLFINGCTGFITESQRNLILQHHNFSVFQKNYASSYMPDTHAAYRDLKPRTALMRAASGMSRTIDRRRPRRLTAAQQAEVNRHPEVRLLRRRLQSQKQWFTIRRVQAINAVTALCSLQECRGFRRRQNSASDTKLKKESTPPTLSESLPLEFQPTQCIFCLGDEGLPAEKRLWSFHSHDDLKKHFYRKHLRYHPEDQPIACPYSRCEATLIGEMHLQNHAEAVHKTPT